MFFRKILIICLFFLLSTIFSITLASDNDETILKSKDMQNQNVSGLTSGSNNNESISPEQALEIQKQMATFKEKQLEALKELEDLDKE